MKRFKLFLASSAELSQERKGIALMINRLNNKWSEEKDVYIELVIWEDLPHSFRGEDIQTYFNREMLTCDMVLALFFKKVGQFTEEEFSEEYDKKYKSIFKKNQEEISQWADLAVEKLHSMSDKQLLEYFPNTTPVELKQFRESREKKD